MTLITDGLPAYHDAYKKEFWMLKGPRTEHVRHIKLKGDMNNNKMERLNGEIRDLIQDNDKQDILKKQLDSIVIETEFADDVIVLPC